MQINPIVISHFLIQLNCYLEEAGDSSVKKSQLNCRQLPRVVLKTSIPLDMIEHNANYGAKIETQPSNPRALSLGIF